MVDILGIPLEVGDEVVYTNGRQDYSLYRATIARIDTTKPTHTATLLYRSGRISQKPRTRYQLLSLALMKKAYPEIIL